MKNWFLSKSVAVRAAIIILAVAVLTEAGVGAVALSKRQQKTPVTEDVVVSEQVEVVEDVKETIEVKEEKVEEVVKAEPEVTEAVVETLAYVKTSTDLENGDFSNGIDAWEVYSYMENNISYNVDDAFEISIDETGTEDWHVQLKQTGIRLESGKWYVVSLDAKSSINRKIQCTMQRDGMIHNDDWTPYSAATKFAVGKNWCNYQMVFQMPEATDNAAVISFSLGTIEGKKITTGHSVSLDNISLKKLPDNWTDSLKEGDNLIGNANFAYADTLWEGSVVAPGAANVSFDNNKATFAISNPGSVDWHVQLKQNGIKLDNNTGYRLTFKASSTAARTIKVGFMDTNYVNWYGGGDVVLPAGTEQSYTVDFYNSVAPDANTVMMVSMGKIEGVSTPASTITLSDFRLVKCSEVKPGAGGAGGGSWPNPNHNLSNGWVVYDDGCAHTSSVSEKNGVVTIGIRNSGNEDWHVQMQKKGVSLTKDQWYKITFDANSTLEREIACTMMKNGSSDNVWTNYSGNGYKTLTPDWQSYEIVFKMTNDSDSKAIFNFSLGKVNGKKITTKHTVQIKNMKIEETTEPETPAPEVGAELLANPSIDGSTGWNFYANSPAAATVDYTNGTAVIDITNPGANPWDIGFQGDNLYIEQGAKYEVEIEAISSVTRDIKVAVQTLSDQNYHAMGEKTFTVTNLNPVNRVLSNGENGKYSFTFTSDRTYKTAQLAINLGNMGNTSASTVTIKSASVKKISDPVEGPTPVATINVVVSGDDRKGEYVLDPTALGITNPVGKKIKFTAKLKSSGKFLGAIAGNIPSGWSQSDQFTSEDGSEMTWEYVLDTYVDYAKIDIWYMSADTIDIMEVKAEDVSEGPAPVATINVVVSGDDRKGEYVLNPTDLGITDPVGKKIKFTAKLKSSGKFLGAIAGNIPSGWSQSDQFTSEDGSEMTWEYVLDTYVDYAKIDIWYMSADTIDIMEVKAEVVSEEAASVLTFDVVDHVGTADIPASILAPYAGKNIKITAVLEADGMFKGAIGANSTNPEQGWYQVGEFESTDGSATEWTLEVMSFKDYAKFELYWAEATKVTVKSITVVEIAAPASKEVANVSEKNETEEEKQEASLEAVVEEIKDPEAEVDEEEADDASEEETEEVEVEETEEEIIIIL